MKKILALLVTVMLLASMTCAMAEEKALFTGVDTKLSGEITIYQYYADASVPFIDYAVAKMNAKYPNLKINIEHRADSDGTALKTWAAVGELPDLFEIPAAETYQTLKENGDLYALDSAAESTGYYSLFSNGEKSKKAHTDTDGHMYSLGSGVTNVFTVFYNVSLFKELGLSEPTNFEEFKNCITVLKNAGKIPIALFGAEQWPAMAFYELACVAEGADKASNAMIDGSAHYTDEAYVKAAKKFQEIVDLGAFGTGALSTNASQAFEMESTGQAGFVGNGSWHWQTTETEGYGDNIDWCNFNVFADADKADAVKNHCVGGVTNLHAYSVNAKPPSGIDPAILAQLAFEFNYYFELANAEKGNMTTVLGDFSFAGAAGYKDFSDNYNNLVTFTVFPMDMSDGKLVSSLGNALEMMVSGNYSAEDFTEEMTASGY